MTENRNQSREIEAGERWLREVCKEPPSPSLDRIKLRVRIAAQELWLTSQLSDEAPEALLDRMKDVVRAEVGVSEAIPPLTTATVGIRRFAWWSMGVAGAAAAVLFAFVGLPNGRGAASQGTYVDAFISVDYDDFDAAIDTLSAEVDDIESGLYASSLAQLDDWMYLNIGEGLDDVPSTTFTDDDWLPPDGLDSFLEGSGT